MKKIVSIILLVFAFTLNAEAQKKGGKLNVNNMLKKLTSDLNLTDAQQAKIKPLLVAQIADRKAMGSKRKALKESGEKLSKADRKKMRDEKVAKETALKTKMASILDKDQFAKYEEVLKSKKKKGKKMLKKKRKDNK